MSAGSDHATAEGTTPPSAADADTEMAGLADLFARAPGGDGATADDERRDRIQRALVFIEQNLSSRIEVADVARVACYTPRHFQRVFRQVTGESVYHHIRRLRVEHAALLLKAWDWPVTEIALACGFDTPGGLDKAFASIHGLSPIHYRDNHRLGHSGDRGATPPLLRVRTEKLPAMRVAFLRHIGNPLHSVRTWTRLLAWAWRRGLLRDHPQPIGICRDDDDVPMNRQRYDVGFVVSDSFEPDEGVGCVDVPGGTVLMHHFRGTAKALEARWSLFGGAWFPASGLQLRLPFGFDLYSPRHLEFRNLARAILSPNPILDATLCMPVSESPSSIPMAGRP